MKRVLLVAMVLGIASAASAQVSPIQPPGEAAIMPSFDDSPGFMFMDKVHSTSMVSIDGGLTLFDGAMATDVTGFRLDLHGQVVTPTGLGGYATLPLLFASFDTGDGSDSDTQLGNLEVGGLYAVRLPGYSIIGRAGLALPTARNDDGDFGFGSAALVANVYTDIANLALVIPETTTLRLSGTLEGRVGQLFFRGDVGLDAPVDSPGDSVDPLVRLNAAGGVSFGAASIALELVTTGTTNSDIEDEDRFFHTIGVSARFTQGMVSPAVAVGFPLDQQVRDLVQVYLFAGIDVAVGAFGF